MAKAYDWVLCYGNNSKIDFGSIEFKRVYFGKGGPVPDISDALRYRGTRRTSAAEIKKALIPLGGIQISEKELRVYGAVEVQ